MDILTHCDAGGAARGGLVEHEPSPDVLSFGSWCAVNAPLGCHHRAAT